MNTTHRIELAVIGLFLPLMGSAQTRLEFEVASIRPAAPTETAAGVHIDGSQVRYTRLSPRDREFQHRGETARRRHSHSGSANAASLARRPVPDAVASRNERIFGVCPRSREGRIEGEGTPTRP